jgi:phosphotriesterase-related protein
MPDQPRLEPRNANLAGRVQTVLGPIPAERLGVTTTHEHLLADLSHLQKPPVEASRRATFYAPLSMELLGRINFGGHTSLDNSRLLDVETAIGEALLFKRRAAMPSSRRPASGSGAIPRASDRSRGPRAST